MIIAQEPTQSLATLHRPLAGAVRSPGKQQDVAPYGQIICPTDAPSRRITMIVAQEPTQSLATLHRPLALTIRHQRK
jgi:hypothetical protein